MFETTIVDRRGREDAVMYVPDPKGSHDSPYSAFNEPGPEKWRLNLPFSISPREPQISCSSGCSGSALGGGFGSIDGPGFDGKAS